MTLTREQLLAMLEMQDAMNTRVNTGWLEADYPFLRAVVIEGAEAIEHASWKWWKAQERDLAQLQMELVDIWHFALSAALVSSAGDHPAAAAKMHHGIESPGSSVDLDGQTYWIDDLDVIRKLEILIGLAVVRRFSVSLFHGLLQDCEMSWEALYRQYMGKNVLNMFRQNHGYKAGTYQKHWGGREDNEHLVEILKSENDALPDFRQRVYAQLELRYLKSIVSTSE